MKTRSHNSVIFSPISLSAASRLPEDLGGLPNNTFKPKKSSTESKRKKTEEISKTLKKAPTDDVEECFQAQLCGRIVSDLIVIIYDATLTNPIGGACPKPLLKLSKLATPSAA